MGLVMGETVGGELARAVFESANVGVEGGPTAVSGPGPDSATQ